MQIVEPSYRIIRPESPEDAIKELRYIEREARRCYKTEDKITSDSYLKMVKMLRDKRHDAMLGFGELHVEFVCDRGVTHEMVRHRLCEFAQESTRYCDYTGNGIQVICPPDILDNVPAYNTWVMAMHQAEKAYLDLREAFKPQIARAVLPTCLKTEIGWKADFQEWRHIFMQRTASVAHPQMLELMVPLLAEVKQLIPIVFDDL